MEIIGGTAIGDALDGPSGDDTIYGLGGNDIIDGGVDIIDGGVDIIDGGDSNQRQ